MNSCSFCVQDPDPAPWDVEVSFDAAGNLDCLKWLLTQDPPCPCNDALLFQLVKMGDLDSIKWLRSLPWIPLSWWDGADLIEHAATWGSLDVLKWLRAQDPPCPWTERTCEMAAANDNLDVLQWIRAQKPPCPWDIDCTAAAARHGHMRVLEWLSAQDPPCPWGPESSHGAAAGGHLQALEFLHSHGCSVTSSAYYAAAFGGHRQILRWLQTQKIPVPSHPPSALLAVSAPMLLFLGDISAPLPADRHAELQKARRAFCTFHGLLRWCRSAMSDPSRGAHHAFDYLCNESAGQELLVLLARLPPELVTKIAVAAHLQHGVFQ